LVRHARSRKACPTWPLAPQKISTALNLSEHTRAC
jgi:hypothetical protein